MAPILGPENGHDSVPRNWPRYMNPLSKPRKWPRFCAQKMGTILCPKNGPSSGSRKWPRFCAQKMAPNPGPENGHDSVPRNWPRICSRFLHQPQGNASKAQPTPPCKFRCLRNRNMHSFRARFSGALCPRTLLCGHTEDEAMSTENFKNVQKRSRRPIKR